MSRPLKILLVDDDPALVKTLTLFLQYEGHEVYSTTNPLDAYTQATMRHFDLVIADLIMHQMDGVEFVSRCKKRQSGLEAILITGHWDKLPPDRNLCALFKAILAKPLDIDLLIEQINTIQVNGNQGK